MMPETQQPSEQDVNSPQSPVSNEAAITGTSSPTWYQADAAVSSDSAPYSSQSSPLVGESDVVWSASEFVAHDKPPLWYGALTLAGLVLAVLAYLLTKDLIMASVVVVALAAFGVMATRKPRVLDYALDDHGVRIAQKHYPYTSFKSFSLITVGALHAVDLLPMERFKPLITLYFPPEQEGAILDKLGASLAYQEREMDTVDRLMHRLRF